MNTDPSLENIDRNENTLVEILIKNRTEAQEKFKELARTEQIVWLDLSNQESIIGIDSFLSTQPTDKSIFLYLPFTLISWEECSAKLMLSLDETLYALWPEELKLYLAHEGQPFDFE